MLRHSAFVLLLALVVHSAPADLVVHSAPADDIVPESPGALTAVQEEPFENENTDRDANSEVTNDIEDADIEDADTEGSTDEEDIDTNNPFVSAVQEDAFESAGEDGNSELTGDIEDSADEEDATTSLAQSLDKKWGTRRTFGQTRLSRSPTLPTRSPTRRPTRNPTRPTRSPTRTPGADGTNIHASHGAYLSHVLRRRAPTRSPTRKPTIGATRRRRLPGQKAAATRRGRRGGAKRG